MVSALLSRCLILILGTLYPAYRSYKAIKNKDLREHVKWMMYWIVFALFTTLETFLDVFVSWFPFYYEIKIIFILWVLSPATRGSSILYKKVVHPMLIAREKEIDEMIEKTKVQGYSTFIQLFTQAFNYASTLFMNSAMRGQTMLGAQIKNTISAIDDTYNNEQQSSGIQRRDDDESSSEFDHEPEVIQRQTSKISKKHNSKSAYDLIADDEVLLCDDYNSIPAQRKASVDKSTIKRKTNRQVDPMNYRSYESSHYGTITRGKVTKTRSQAHNSNESDQ